MATILERNKNLKPVKKTRAEYAEDALYREVWEEVNNEKTMAFVKKYSRAMMTVALVLMIGVVGLQIGMRAYHDNRIAMAAAYETAIESVDANALAAMSENASGATADLALFQAYLIDHDIEKLERLAIDGNTRDFRDLARLHVVNARGDDMTATDMVEYLSDLDTKDSPFYYTSHLTIAQKYLADGDVDAANRHLDLIINDTDAPSVIKATAQTLR